MTLTRIFSSAAVAVTLLATSSLHAQQIRSWTNSAGNSFQGKYVEMVDAETVRVRRTSSGKTYKIKLDTLTEADQNYVATIQAELAQAAKMANIKDAKIDWNEDYEEVQTTAKALDRPILILFTGSDWCPPCKAFEERIAHEDAFLDYAQENLVLMMADFPRGKSQSRKVKAQNSELASQYKITGYPTLLLTDASGEAIAEVPRGSSPKSFVQNIKLALK